MEIDIAHFETLAQIEKSFSDYLAFIGQYAMDLNDYELTYTIKDVPMLGYFEGIIQQSLKRVKLIVDQTYPISVRRKEASIVKNQYNALLSPSESSDTRSMKLYAILPNTAPATQLELESWAMEIAINFQTKFVVEE